MSSTPGGGEPINGGESSSVLSSRDTVGAGRRAPGMSAEEESCRSRARESFSCGSLPDNRGPVMLTYAAK